MSTPPSAESTFDSDVARTFAAMAGRVTVRVIGASGSAEAIEAVQELFARVESECTQFDQESPLMLANSAGPQWQSVPELCFAAITEAAEAHRFTDGLFDPRVLRSLTALGYDRTLPFASGQVVTTSTNHARGVEAPWRPEFDPEARAVRIGPDPIDLGAIGKGLALRWAAQLLAPRCTAFLVEAGGDCVLGGSGPDGAGWQVGVEDPRRGDWLVAVVRLVDLACATSSVRIRHWTVGDRPVHHLIDPRTGQPGGAGLLSVTVVGTDPAAAEVWSKVLFLHDAEAIAAAATAHDLAALWVYQDGRYEMTDAMRPYVIWQASQ